MEKCIAWAKVRGVRKWQNLLIHSGIAIRQRFFRSRCQRGSASHMVGCQFSGTQKERLIGAQSFLAAGRFFEASDENEVP
jgi:hypothetical protein